MMIREHHESRLFNTLSKSEMGDGHHLYLDYLYDGWTYLASVMDIHSKMIMGITIKRHMKQEIVLESLTPSGV